MSELTSAAAILLGCAEDEITDIKPVAYQVTITKKVSEHHRQTFTRRLIIGEAPLELP